jgi:hypothetical protein
MIRYALKCEDAHRFDAWFGSSADYDRLQSARLVTCAVCGSPAVEKDLMAPALRSGAGEALASADARRETRPAPAGAPTGVPSPAPTGVPTGVPSTAPPAREVPDLRAPASPAERALRELRRRIEAVADNVGRDFAREARAIHAGEAPDRPILGEARPDEARALLEEGIPVAPLPWGPRRAN